MKGPSLIILARGQAVVIGLSAAALLLAGCSERNEPPKPEQRATVATNTPTELQPSQTNAIGQPRERTDAEVFGVGETNADAGGNKGFVVLEPELTPQQVADLKTKAEGGDAEAANELAWCYYTGRGVTRDFGAAVAWWRRAADHAQEPQADAQFVLGRAYYVGVVVPQDYAEAANWYRRSAELGFARAQSELGQMHLRGEGVRTNVSEGLRLIQLAIAGYEAELRELESRTNAGYPSTARWAFTTDGTRPLIAQKCRQVGDIFYEGVVVPKDITNAIHYYEILAECRNDFGDLYDDSIHAQFQLGYIHATETKNTAEAIKWFRKRAEAGDTTAQCNLALLYYKGGVGVASDWQQAASWYRKAAEAGNVEAQVNIAEMYQDGEGVPRDYGEAVKWLQRSAEQGHCGAQINLGVAYTRAEGIPRDYVEAYKWFNLAAASADHPARREVASKNLDMVTRLMTPDQIADAQRRSSAFVARKETEATNPPATFRRDIEPERPQASGTAFFITDDGYLLTSAHVVSPRETKTADGFLDAHPISKVTVTVAGKTLTAKLVKADKANDVAVLRVSGDFNALPLVASRTVKLGDTICTLGFPNTEIQGTEPKFTTGEINSLAGVQDDPRHFQISVPVQPGNSGGPLLDSSGNVIGLVSARLADIATLKITGSLPQNVNYALKSSFITAFLETLPEVTAKLKSPRPAKARPLSDIAAEAKPSVALVMVY